MSSAGPESARERKRDLSVLVGLALLAVFIRRGALRVGLMSDDFMQHAMLEGLYPGGDSYAPFDLYAFLRRGPTMIAHVEQGTAPWWSAPDLHGTVLRPLASLLLWLDHTLVPGQVVLWHLHSLLWLAAAVVALGLATRALLPRSIALLAVVLFACEAGLVSPLAWLANRCVLVCATFGFLAVWAHIEWRRPGPATPAWLKRHGGAAVAVFSSASIAAGEYGLGVVAFVAAWELLVGSGSVGARLRALVPATAPILVYLALHKLLGYGTFGAEVYADPFHAPLGYLEWASKRIPKLIAAGLWSIPGATIHVFRFGLPKHFDDMWITPDAEPEVYHRAHVNMALLGVALAAIALALARRGWTDDERRSLRVLGLGGFLGLLPVAIAPAHSRLLVVAQLAACALVAATLVGWVRLLLGRVPEAGQPAPPLHLRLRGALLTPLALTLAWSHTIGDIRWGDAYMEHLDKLQASNIEAFVRGDILDHELAGRDVVILNGPSQSVGLFGSFVLHSVGWEVPRSWRPLAVGSQFSFFASRPSTHELELSTVQGEWLHTAGELFFRREDQPLPAGTTLTYPTLRAEVLADHDGHPTRVRFRFDRDLDDPSLLFVVSTPEGLLRWQVPPIGGRNVVPLPRLPKIDDPDAIEFPTPKD